MCNTRFIRTLWGIPSKEWIYKRRRKMDSDFGLVLHNQFEKPCTVYVFGKDNMKCIEDMGFDCRLVDDRPMVWDPTKKEHQYGHKIQVLQAAMNEFEEIIFLDWDCVAARSLPQNLWQQLRNKAPIQASLRGYKVKRAGWRKRDTRKRPCASFVYIREKKIADDMFELWKSRKVLSDEHILGMYMDSLIGGWQGTEKYWELFEPYCFNLGKHEVPFHVYDYDLLKNKELYFLHLNSSRRGAVLKEVDESKSKEVNQQIVADALKFQLDTLVLDNIKRKKVEGEIK